MTLPRWYHRLYAWLFGYFWLPCPLCGRKFGGHESGTGTVPTGRGTGWMTCSRHSAADTASLWKESE